MDVLNDTLFDEEKTQTPFPSSDYNKKGELRKVRGRVLKKLLKYEVKVFLKPMLIVFSVVFAVAFALCVLGLFAVERTPAGEQEESRMVIWTIFAVLFVYYLLFATIFPVVLGARRYHRQFFSSEAYLTLSIPASPEEHVLAKRISAYLAVIAAAFLCLIAIFIVMIPLVINSEPLPPGETSQPLGAWNILYIFIELLFSPMLFLAICGGFCCWRHRGLKSWMILIMAAGSYLCLVTLGITFGANDFTIPEKVMNFFSTVGKWIWLVLRGGILYLLFRYETQTLRKKINLK